MKGFGLPWKSKAKQGTENNQAATGPTNQPSAQKKGGMFAMLPGFNTGKA